ncbi:MAG TPA: prepilin-type N-terminal cleavage/methylation domain-containing protein [Candidatus Methylomirabilis sp.]|nr:prepilin-type N-terminal cleavage/methylation domain-containing protein [Candidatus Methylomirabilis sp.]
MRRGESGFSLLELMIALVIVASVLAAASTFFIGTVRQYKVQTKITESNVEGVIGLELLRQDVESLGFGLPWNGFPFAYTERSGVHASITALNETPNAPRAVVSINNAPSGVALNGSDYLVIRSARVGMDNAAGKWTTLSSTGGKRNWSSQDDDLLNTDYVTVLAPGTVASDRQSLVGTSTYALTGGLVPTESFQTNIVYGIGAAAPVRPFNRADYFIADNTTNPPYSRPRHCASNTGVLVKAAIAHDVPGTPTLFPLLDCVADMKVVYGLDTDANGLVDNTTNTVAGLTAANLRAQLLELRIHILAQVGQRDDSFNYPATTVSVGSGGFIDNVDVSGFRNYRWKVYNIVVRPKNLGI